MATIRSMDMFDLLKFNNVNLDLLTETFYTNFYGKYLNKWGEFCVVSEDTVSNIQGYLIAKVEGYKGNEQIRDWHSHVSAVTVAPQYRRQGLAKALMQYMHEVSIKRHDAYFVDLFVRPSNSVAVGFYEKLGYKVFRTVTGYYSSNDSNSEDAYDMRMSLPKDTTGELSIPLNKSIMPNELEYI